jgi:Domain of unknown function (DUF4348)
MRYSIIILLMFLGGCESKPQKKAIKENEIDSAESFDTFLTKFSSDSIFQNSRIKFPLLSKIDDGELGEQNFISQKEWGFSDLTKFKSPKYNLTKEKINDKEYHLTFQIQDTGVHVIYVFVKENSKWVLTTIIDNGE